MADEESIGDVEMRLSRRSVVQGRLGRGRGWLPLCPKVLPGLGYCVEDIGASAEALAEFLEVPIERLRSWLAGVTAPPRTVALSLFWMTQVGRSLVNHAAENDAATYSGMVLSLMSVVDRQAELLRTLGGLSDFGAANDPHPMVPLRRLSPSEKLELQAEFVRVLSRAAA